MKKTKIFFNETDDIIDICYDNVFKAVFTRGTSTSQGALSRLISALICREITVITINANEPPINCAVPHKWTRKNKKSQELNAYFKIFAHSNRSPIVRSVSAGLHYARHSQTVQSTARSFRLRSTTDQPVAERSRSCRRLRQSTGNVKGVLTNPLNTLPGGKNAAMISYKSYKNMSTTRGTPNIYFFNYS